MSSTVTIRKLQIRYCKETDKADLWPFVL